MGLVALSPEDIESLRQEIEQIILDEIKNFGNDIEKQLNGKYGAFLKIAGIDSVSIKIKNPKVKVTFV